MSATPPSQPPESEFGITFLALGDVPFIGISREEFLRVQRAHKTIEKAIQEEQSFVVCVENYFELEQELLNLSLGHMIYRSTPWQSRAEMRVTTSRRILNLLSAATSYEDQTKRIGNPSRDHHLHKFKEELKAKSVYYRHGRSLRNVVIHQDFDVSPPTWQLSWDRDLDPPQCAFRTNLRLDMARLSTRKGRGDYQRMIGELQQTGDPVDFLRIIRGYVEDLGSVHEKARELTKADRNEAREAYDRVLQRREQFCGQSGFDVVERNLEGETLKSYYVSARVLDYLRSLEGKNSVFKNLSRRYVTSMADVKKKPPAPPGSDAWEE